MVVLRTEGLVKRYKTRVVVNKADLALRQGEIVGLLGPNGAGKTTTFYMIVGLISPNKGRVLLGEKDITDLPMYKRARAGIGYLSQEPSVFQRLTVEENILAILETMELTKEERSRKLNSLLRELNISYLAKQKAYTLSGGERRRTEIARALITSPRFMLLDEPFLGVDPITVLDIQEIIIKLREKGLGILITDHQVRETLEITDRAYIMYQGEILISGTSDVLVKDEKARKIYLGEKFTLGQTLN
ncbi:MAG: LPS export ABC transporter ATP-binding protein [bacterium]|nr:LPS export ABC transporter ATP-binding protein [bacterium]